MVAGTLALTGGCTSIGRLVSGGWVADYDSAEKLQRADGGDMLIFYKASQPNKNHIIRKALRDGSIRTVVSNHVRCLLFKEYEPDRRYVAQYGIERAPALIVVRADGTHHALVNPACTEDVRSFLESCDRPGSKPTLNPHIPRKPAYCWLDDIEQAETMGRETASPVLVVLCRSFTRDFSELSKLLDNPEVYARLRNLVHCRPSLLFGSKKAVMERFGVTELPALIILDPEGIFFVLEKPLSSDALVSFADQCGLAFCDQAADVRDKP